MYKIIENKFSEEEEKMTKFGEPLMHNIKNKIFEFERREELLHWAAANGNLPLFQLIIDNPLVIDKNPRAKDCFTPLNRAAKNGHLKVCELILDNIYEIGEFKGWTPFHHAAKYGYFDICAAFINHFKRRKIQNRNPGDVRGATPLHLAARNGNMELFKLIFSCITQNLNPANADGETPLHWAVKNRNWTICEFIIANITPECTNPADGQGNTPLHHAVQIGKVDSFFKIFTSITQGKNPANNVGDTPLHLAVKFGHFAIASTIMKRLENKNPVNKQGKTPLDFAKYSEDFGGVTPLHLAALCGDHDIFMKIFENIQSSNQPNVDGNTPLHWALESGNLTSGSVIMANVGDKNPVNKAGKTPMDLTKNYYVDSKGTTLLHLAALTGDYNLFQGIFVKVCVKAEDKNPADIHGNTPLHWAVESGHLAISNLIMKNVENKNPFNNEGIAPLDLARNHSNPQIYQHMIRGMLPNQPLKDINGLQFETNSSDLEVVFKDKKNSNISTDRNESVIVLAEGTDESVIYLADDMAELLLET